MRAVRVQFWSMCGWVANCEWVRSGLLPWLRLNGAAVAVAITIVCFVAELKTRDEGEQPSNAPDPDTSQTLEQAKLLFDYTKFHITVYTTIATLLVAATSGGLAKDWALSPSLMRAAVVAIVGAGLAAGVVAASLPECVAKHDFWNWRTGPYQSKLLTIRSWTFVEHSSFWLAVLLIVAAFAFSAPSPSSDAEVVMSIKIR